MTLSQLRDEKNLEWWRGATIYQIYPRSFMDANGDGIGDLPGITLRLDYVASLGVDAVWLSPFFTSPMKDFGYDVADYRNVDPMFGTLDDFCALVVRAHELGLRVIIDQVLSHSSDLHPWFQESRQNRHNAKADWYVWADPRPDGNAPNNWMAAFGGRSWSFDSRRRQYYLHNFLSSQPDLNFHNPQVQHAQLDNLRFWLELGVDGFRFDVVNYYFHDPALTDNPPAPPDRVSPANPQSYQGQQYNIEQPENLAFLERVRALLDEYPGATSIGEIAGDNQLATMAAYTAGDTRLHMAYTFDLLDSMGDAEQLYRVLTRFTELDDDTWPCWSLSNHDVVRSASRWREPRALLAVAFLCSLRGSLGLYQGEELGLPEAELAFEDLQDPFGINLWPEIKGRDGSRTPMPWNASINSGFSTSPERPWLPIDPRHPQLAVEAQNANPHSLLMQVRRLLHLRAEEEVLRRGEQLLLPPETLPQNVFALLRTLGERRLLCLVNLGEEQEFSLRPAALVNDVKDWQSLPLPEPIAAQRAGDTIRLPPGTAAWLVLV
ncbi:alpha-glucosidase [Halomonas sp. M20]|uniref:alpha-glucosidase n=1 Tax=Halomonas sp. M20 TaxID=2763264 RepID=UPI001D0AA98F|nr:alpha-glucosidase [Halomonas sp. M20]